MSEEKKTKKGVRRNRAAGGSTPNPEMQSTCGHSHCSSRCNVRYVGPVSHPRDHHIWHAAQGVGNIWTAVVITGLAIVLTGAVAFTSVQAQTQDNTVSRADYMKLMNRLEVMEQSVHDIHDLCGAKAPSDITTSPVDTGDATGTKPLPKAPHKK